MQMTAVSQQMIEIHGESLVSGKQESAKGTNEVSTPFTEILIQMLSADVSSREGELPIGSMIDGEGSEAEIRHDQADEDLADAEAISTDGRAAASMMQFMISVARLPDLVLSPVSLPSEGSSFFSASALQESMDSSNQTSVRPIPEQVGGLFDVSPENHAQETEPNQAPGFLITDGIEDQGLSFETDVSLSRNGIMDQDETSRQDHTDFGYFPPERLEKSPYEMLAAIAGYKSQDENSAIANEKEKTAFDDYKSVFFHPIENNRAAFPEFQAQEPIDEAKSVQRSIIEQIVEKATLLREEDRMELTVQLKPDSLGKLSIKLTSENGVTTAQIIADHFETGELLQGQISILKQQLGEQGIHIHELNVTYGGGAFSGSQQRGEGGSANGRGSSFHLSYNQQKDFSEGNEPPGGSRIYHTGLINYLI